VDTDLREQRILEEALHEPQLDSRKLATSRAKDLLLRTNPPSAAPPQDPDHDVQYGQ
jgi:hypothetical protein